MGRLDGKRALVTAAGSGIGRAVAIGFGREGAAVAVSDIEQERIDEVVGEITSAGGTAIGLKLDVTDNMAIEDGVSRVVSEFGGLDTLVNNAGRATAGSIEEVTREQWDGEFALNVTSALLLTQAAWPYLREAGGGSVTNASSVAGLWAQRGNIAYCSAKAAVLMMTKCMALDGAAENIRVNCVCPGFTDTPMLSGFFELQADPAGARRMSERAHPIERLGSPDEIADGYIYLASATWVTGVALPVDGGFTAGSRWQDFAL
jgi:NAD(P)-dependent dehydrogenase (short-subunit alcohol dehydrogenase family)